MRLGSWTAAEKGSDTKEFELLYGVGSTDRF